MSDLSPLERVRYFTGKLLSASDLEQEQDYLLARFRRHHRFLHGWGIVTGLGVSKDGNASVTVAAGLAIDCAGNELALDEPVQLSLAGLTGKLFVTIRYCELLVAPQPAMGQATEFTRIRETVSVELDCANHVAGHRGMGQKTPGCGQPHALCLATLSKRGTRWRLATPSRKGRR